MKLAHQLDALGGVGGPLVLAVGFLDGVHRGHQAVIRTAVARAAERGGRAWILTLEPHPLKVLAPERAPLLITPTLLKIRYLEALGPDGCLLLPFTKDFAAWEPEMFLARLGEAAPELVEIVVGDNWTFGRGARGDVALLRAWAGGRGIAVTIVPPVHDGGHPVSSTRIRREIEAGHVEEAARLLGRPFAIVGTVEHGRAIGRALGYPTANVPVHGELSPAPGIYAVRVTTGDAETGGAGYIGRRPTFDEAGDPVLEVHLLTDRDPDLYGRELLVEFVAFIREDRKFDSREALQTQIGSDIASIRKALAGFSSKPAEIV